MSLDNGVTPNFTYEKSVTDEDTGEITYINLTIHKSAEEVYQEWLYNKDNPPVAQPTLEHKITLLEEKVGTLEVENTELQDSQMGQDFIIDDLIFEVIPTLEAQINMNNTEPVQLANVFSTKLLKTKGGNGMAAYLAKKIMDGRDYTVVFKTYSYKQYQDEVDTILELEGRGDLIKR